ncbi:hypothetical protein BS47DRAFT_1320937 [Hydnum rufescens UP504]|uniref:SPO22-domain-containing protein n=1 Tax=Hydnum rufescens UP504 TaxID=1448309 RepID=A0A9P6DMJ1_9AGAM|nr:hypothetical protein BS47DRAFT_1320937 [Hydnum rufescens UP504]
MEVLTCAATFEEAMRSMIDQNNENAKSKAIAIVSYYIGRMDVAWRDGNENVAYFMLQQALDQQHLDLLPTFDRDHVATKVLEIGKSLLKSVPSESVVLEPGSTSNAPRSDVKRSEIAMSSIKWLRHAFQILENSVVGEDVLFAQATGAGTGSGSRNKALKRAILRSLARAYYVSSFTETDNLARAEATLNELMNLMPAGGEQSENEMPSVGSTVNREEIQQVRWMKVAVLKRRKAGGIELILALSDIVRHMTFSEANLGDLLEELTSLGEPYRQVLVEVVLEAIKAALVITGGQPFVERLLLFLVFHVKSDPNPQQAIRDIELACSSITSVPGFEMAKGAIRACQSILWVIGDKLYNKKDWNRAASWYLLSAHAAFGAVPNSTTSKCLRKAALCRIQQGEYAQASSIVRRCPGNEAAAYYVTFLAAAHQGLEDEATAAVHDMVKASDFDRQMLLLATQLAHENQMKRLLLAVLGSLLQTLHSEAGLASEVEAIILVRCMVRLILELLKEPGADVPLLSKALIQHFGSGREIIQAALSKKEAAVVLKDISWLWRTAYNTAVQGCIDWPSEIVSDLFDISREARLMENYQAASIGDSDPSLDFYMILASFASVAGRVFSGRQMPDSTKLYREKIVADIRSLKRLIHTSGRKVQDDTQRERLVFVMHFTFLFEVEQLCRMAEWDSILRVFKELSESQVTLNIDTYEALGDILWAEEDCPSDVLFTALERILHTCLNRNMFAVEKFSRWLRAICTILLARNRPPDRLKALTYIEQATDVVRDNSESVDGEEVYPMDERQWIFTVSYNTGVECFSASLLDEAKRWFESAAVLSKFLADHGLADKVAETYKSLLARYGND